MLERRNEGEKQVFNSKRDNQTKSVLSKYVLIASAMFCCIVILLQSSVTMFLFASMEFLTNSEYSLMRNPHLSINITVEYHLWPHRNCTFSSL
jgi:hypothetical protein